MLKSLTILLFSLGALTASAQRVTSVGFWNLENLYDTVPSLFHDDRDYLPGGALRWPEGRYERKLTNLAQVIDEMALDVLGVCEIESEEAIRDLVLSLKTDYNYIHRHSNDFRGMDVAMLYKGDRFFPESVRQIEVGYSRALLHVKGELAGVDVDILICHMPSQLNQRQHRDEIMMRLGRVVDSLPGADSTRRVILMGDMNANPTDKTLRRALTLKDERPLTNLLEPSYRNGHGTYVYKDRWHLYDHIYLSENLLTTSDGKSSLASCGIYIRSYMLGAQADARRGYPLRTFSGKSYLGGYSDHLPVYVSLVLE